MAAMLLEDFDTLIRKLLSLEELEGIDDSMNGIQVGRPGKILKKAAFAVDASLESFRRAQEWQADLLFVHHGLFWGKPLAIAGGHYRRIKALLDSDCALYATHLPLDMHPELGNNAGIAEMLNLEDVKPFGMYHGVTIGCKGRFKEEKRLDEVIQTLGGPDIRALPFGPGAISTVGIVSGGAAREVLQAIEEGLDLYITGDSAHSFYHDCLEAGINVLFGGHYLTEIWGVKLLAEKLKVETDLETCFIDIPTGL